MLAHRLRRWHNIKTTLAQRLVIAGHAVNNYLAVVHNNFPLHNFVVFLFQYFYSIKDISIGGRCVCNGHASVCDKADPADAAKLLCRCQHNTCGSQCETCCPGYVQKPWKPATLDGSNECERTLSLQQKNNTVKLCEMTMPTGYTALLRR